MMRWIIGSSLKLRLVVVTLAALLMVFGFTQLRHMPVDALPEFSRPYVELQIEALGLSAQEVEALITTPLEADMLNGTPWAKEIRSVSLPGLSSITLIFEKGTDVMRARQMVQERLVEVFALPRVAKQFTMINPLSSAGRVMAIGLTSDKLSLIEMSVLARWTIQPRLLGGPGGANVAIWGRRERQLQVEGGPGKLRDERVTLMQIIKTAGNALWASPLSFLEASTPGTGGWVDTPNQRLGVRHLMPITTAEDLAKVPIEDASSKRLGDVVRVVEDHQPLIGGASVKAAPALMLVVEKFSSAFLIGAVLMIVTLLAFLFNWRTALISTVAILVSVIAVGTVLYVRGVTINMMIRAGVRLALCAVTDAAIFDTENVVRRLRRAREEGSRKSTSTIIFNAALEMRTHILYATAIMVLAG